MTNPNNKLKSLIRKLVDEIINEETDDELSEVNTTSNIQGYQTPNAFSGEDEETHKKDMKSRAEVFDYKTTENEGNNSVKLNESKSLYHVFRDHPDLTPRQKIGVTMRHINKTLTEVEKYLDVTSRVKSEHKGPSNSYWKTTNKYLAKLDEKIQKISRKIREMK